MRNFNQTLIILILFITCGCKLTQQQMTERLQGVWHLEKSFVFSEGLNQPPINNSEKHFLFDTIKFEGNTHVLYAKNNDGVKIIKGDFDIFDNNVLVLKNKLFSPSYPDSIKLKRDSLLIKTINKSKLKLQVTLPVKCGNCNDKDFFPFAAPKDADQPKYVTIKAIFKKE